MELNIIEQIKQFGIDKIVEKYNLKHKDFGHKFSLKYDQLNTPKNKYTNECRGLVLSKDLEVLSMPFYRFSNYRNLSQRDEYDKNFRCKGNGKAKTNKK